MLTTMVIIFILGYTFIILENNIGINKTATALILGIILWILYIFSGPEIIIGANQLQFNDFIRSGSEISTLSRSQQAILYVSNNQAVYQLGNIAEILFYLLGAMTIVEMIDVHGGFSVITRYITTRNKKKLLWLIAGSTFFMSSVLDNLTTTIVILALLHKIISSQQERWIYGSVAVIAANAGGVWTPIGDITTIMLWINDNITAASIMKSLFIPAIISLALPTFLLSFSLKGQITGSAASISQGNAATTAASGKQGKKILILGILSLIFVPVFKSVTQLPPFMGMLFVLGLLWAYSGFLYRQRNNAPTTGIPFRMSAILSKVDHSTILFFLGILLSVSALEACGILSHLSAFLNAHVRNSYIITTAIGLASSVIDNVPLVAGAIGMYPVIAPSALSAASDAAYLSNFVQDGTFWQLIAYGAGTGGSILIIGSAAGVVAMGMEKINFIWYLKRISWTALIGYLAGIAVYALQSHLF